LFYQKAAEIYGMPVGREEVRDKAFLEFQNLTQYPFGKIVDSLKIAVLTEPLLDLIWFS